MKNISLILNIVLIVAVALLYINRFAGSDSDSETGTTEVTAGQGTEIVYINLDSLMNNYDLFNELKTELLQEQQKSEASLNSKLKGYQRRAMEFQQKAQKGLITSSQAEKIQQQLINEQQTLAQLQDKLQKELIDKEQSMNEKIYNRLDEYLKKYNDKKKHKIILGNTMRNVVLQADEALDITNIILEGLNEEYQAGENKTEDTETTEEKTD